MKYIRTKDGVYEFEGHFAWIDNTYIDDKIISYRLLQVKQTPFAVKEFDIIKQADTIEELCDEFVVEDDYDFAIFNNLKLARKTKGTCYGAIRTEWGLKYVAKMNLNGELELL